MDGQRTPEGGRIKRPKRPKIVLEQMALFLKLLSGRTRGKSTAVGCAILSACLIASFISSPKVGATAPPLPQCTFAVHSSWLATVKANPYAPIYPSNTGNQAALVTLNSASPSVGAATAGNYLLVLSTGDPTMISPREWRLTRDAVPGSTTWLDFYFVSSSGRSGSSYTTFYKVETDGTLTRVGSVSGGAGATNIVLGDISCITATNVVLSATGGTHAYAAGFTPPNVLPYADPNYSSPWYFLAAPSGTGSGGTTTIVPNVTVSAGDLTKEYIHSLAVKGAAFCITLAICWFLVKPFIWRFME